MYIIKFEDFDTLETQRFKRQYGKENDRTLSALERYLGVTEKQKQSAIATLDF